MCEFGKEKTKKCNLGKKKNVDQEQKLFERKKEKMFKVTTTQTKKK